MAQCFLHSYGVPVVRFIIVSRGDCLLFFSVFIKSFRGLASCKIFVDTGGWFVYFCFYVYSFYSFSSFFLFIACIVGNYAGVGTGHHIIEDGVLVFCILSFKHNNTHNWERGGAAEFLHSFLNSLFLLRSSHAFFELFFYTLYMLFVLSLLFILYH